MKIVFDSGKSLVLKKDTVTFAIFEWILISQIYFSKFSHEKLPLNARISPLKLKCVTSVSFFSQMDKRQFSYFLFPQILVNISMNLRNL